MEELKNKIVNLEVLKELNEVHKRVHEDFENRKANKQDISSPYNFKGSCLFANLPTTNNKLNDAYYVTDKKCKYSWNGSAWYQSSMSEAEYMDELDGIIKQKGKETGSTKIVYSVGTEEIEIPTMDDIKLLADGTDGRYIDYDNLPMTRGYKKAIKTVWEFGGITKTNGNNENSNIDFGIRTKGFLKLDEGELNLIFNAEPTFIKVRVFKYNEDKSFISCYYDSPDNNINTNININIDDSNCLYRFQIYSKNKETLNSNFQGLYYKKDVYKKEEIPEIVGNDIEIDKTLTNEGQCADAKATGDRIAENLQKIDNLSNEINAITENGDKNLCQSKIMYTNDSGTINGQTIETGRIGDVTEGVTYVFSGDVLIDSTENMIVRVQYGTSVNDYEVQKNKNLKYGTKFFIKFTATKSGFAYISANIHQKSVAVLDNCQLEVGENYTDYIPYGYLAPKGYWDLKNKTDDLIQNVNDLTQDVELLYGMSKQTYRSFIKSVAHQGARNTGFVQNTKENLIACAKSMRWDYVEFDVRFTSDNYPVCSHNPDVTIYGTSDKLTIANTSYIDLYNARLYEDESLHIPTFYEMINTCKIYGIIPVIEIKTQPNKSSIWVQLLDFVKKAGLADVCIWDSFQIGALHEVYKRNPKANLMLAIDYKNVPDANTFMTYDEKVAQCLQTTGDFSIAIDYTKLEAMDDYASWISAFRDKGVSIVIYTLDTIELIKKYRVYADYIVSNKFTVTETF